MQSVFVRLRAKRRRRQGGCRNNRRICSAMSCIYVMGHILRFGNRVCIIRLLRSLRCGGKPQTHFHIIAFLHMVDGAEACFVQTAPQYHFALHAVAALAGSLAVGAKTLHKYRNVARKDVFPMHAYQDHKALQRLPVPLVGYVEHAFAPNKTKTIQRIVSKSATRPTFYKACHKQQYYSELFHVVCFLNVRLKNTLSAFCHACCHRLFEKDFFTLHRLFNQLVIRIIILFQ